jgi:hypothetical protein
MSEAVFFSALLLVSGTIITLASLWFAHAYLERKHERRIPIAVDGLQERLERIEHVVESTAIEVERISEANRFMAKLLADRAGAMNLTGRPEKVITPH